jgi:GAF domain-containing protein
MQHLEIMDLFSQLSAEGPGEAPLGDAVTEALRNRERLREIAALRLTEPDVGHILNDVCREASTALGLPIGLVTILLDEAQHFAAQHGLGGWMDEAGGTPVEWSFCKFTVASKQTFVVEDAHAHALVQNSPLVTQDGLRCYAGIPLVTSRGFAVGSLCVAGTATHEFSTVELQTLERYAKEAIRRIETRRTEGAA